LFQVESRRTLSPSEVALAVHDGMLAVSPVADTFVTAFYGVLHRPSGLLKYIIAGHEHPLLARPGQGIAVLEGRGRFLGMIPQLFLEEYNVEMQPGDRLILFSDGVSDAENPAGENYGTDRLRSVVRVNYHLEAAPLVDAIRADIAAWQQHAPPIDDLAILVVEAR
jgi:sigma-B regulation protein RsbU (phosphoserine phosphatase)